MCINYFSCDKHISRIHIERNDSKSELLSEIKVNQNVGKEIITAKGELL